MRFPTRRGLGLLAAAFALAAVLAAPLVAAPAPAHAAPSSSRLAGADRYTTAVKISRSAYGPGVPVVYIAAGTSFPDALSAAPAAARQGGPLLLTAPGALPDVVRAELSRLKPQRIVVVGGPAVVSTAVGAQLARLAPVTRVYGSDRYATSRAIVQQAFPRGAADGVFLATGAAFPDALSAASVAGKSRAPVLLVNGAATRLDSATAALLRRLGVTHILIAGGTASVSAGVASSAATIAPVAREAGADRFATSAVINADHFPSASRVFLASGAGFADALAGSALAGREKQPLFIVQGGCLPVSVAKALARYGSAPRVLLGGSASLSNAVATGTVCAPPKPPAPKPPRPSTPKPPVSAPKPPVSQPKPPAPSKPAYPADKDCADFAGWQQAEDWFRTYYPYYGDVSRLDADNDMIPCESLPGAP